MANPPETCRTCYGSGESFVDGTPQTCPDCFGEGKALSGSTRVEWRLRAIESAYRGAVDRQTADDVLWLIMEVRRGRDALTRILARCRDADASDGIARDLMHEANAVLELYVPQER
jgi:hypothetical protein